MERNYSRRNQLQSICENDKQSVRRAKEYIFVTDPAISDESHSDNLRFGDIDRLLTADTCTRGGNDNTAENCNDVAVITDVESENKRKRKLSKGRVKIEMAYIENKIKRHTTFSKRKSGIMKKAYELSTLTGTQVMLLVASETGHVYTFATRKLQPIITSDAGKLLIQTCLNSPSSSSDESNIDNDHHHVQHDDTANDDNDCSSHDNDNCNTTVQNDNISPCKKRRQVPSSSQCYKGNDQSVKNSHSKNDYSSSITSTEMVNLWKNPQQDDIYNGTCHSNSGNITIGSAVETGDGFSDDNAINAMNTARITSTIDDVVFRQESVFNNDNSLMNCSTTSTMAVSSSNPTVNNLTDIENMTTTCSAINDGSQSGSSFLQSLTIDGNNVSFPDNNDSSSRIPCVSGHINSNVGDRRRIQMDTSSEQLRELIPNGEDSMRLSFGDVNNKLMPQIGTHSKINSSTIDHNINVGMMNNNNINREHRSTEDKIINNNDNISMIEGLNLLKLPAFRLPNGQIILLAPTSNSSDIGGSNDDKVNISVNR